ncbi:hypothetical protein [Maricaulis sp.]|uniref:hypothetical protein n=1 Tax=Maricaulis sp. TaxID=1486257 RepID=UPI003A8E21EB
MTEAIQPDTPTVGETSFLDGVAHEVQQHFPSFECVGEKALLDGKCIAVFHNKPNSEIRVVFVGAASVAVMSRVHSGMFERTQKLWDVSEWCDEEDQLFLASLITQRLRCLKQLADYAAA